jgi:RimJ/RimL family protein N-acetyltransferase
MDVHPNATIETLDAAGAAGGETALPTRVRTDGLDLRRAHPDHVEFDRFHRLFADPTDAEEVFELCAWNRHADEAETRSYLDRQMDAWDRGGSHEYVMEADGEYVGTAVIDRSADDGSIEYGFWLRKPYWGRGLCGEGVDALVHVSFEYLDAPYVVAGCLPPNGRSRAAIQKFVRRYGGAYFGSPPTVSTRDLDAEETVVAHHEWVITREQFDSGESDISSWVPGVEYDDVEF